MNKSKERVDIIIVGSGIISMICVRYCIMQKLSFKVLALDKFVAKGNRHLSITRTTEETLRKLKLWNKLDQKLYGYFNSIKILGDDGKVKLFFDNLKKSKGPMSWVVEERLLHNYLLESVGEDRQFFKALKIVENTPSGVDLEDQDGEIYSSNLLLITESLDCIKGEPACLAQKKRRYGQLALVGDLETESYHNNIAMQWFLNGDILALLPKSEPNKYSVVFSFTTRSSVDLSKSNLNLLPLELLSEQVGEVLSFENTLSYELFEKWRPAIHYNSLIYLGGAAFSFHPLAGQGLNFSIKNLQKLFAGIDKLNSLDAPDRKQKYLLQINKSSVKDATKLIAFINLIKLFFKLNKSKLKVPHNYLLRLFNKSKFLKNLAVKVAS